MKETDVSTRVSPKTTQLGRYLRTLRKQRKWSLRDLEEKSGVYKSIISRLENGVRRTAHDKILDALANAFQIDAAVLKELGQRPAALPSDKAIDTILAVTSPASDTDTIRQCIIALADVLNEPDWRVQKQRLLQIRRLVNLWLRQLEAADHHNEECELPQPGVSEQP